MIFVVACYASFPFVPKNFLQNHCKIWNLDQFFKLRKRTVHLQLTAESKLVIMPFLTELHSNTISRKLINHSLRNLKFICYETIAVNESTSSKRVKASLRFLTMANRILLFASWSERNL